MSPVKRNRTMSKTTVLMMMFAGVMAVVPSSYAVPITFEYEGVVTNVNDDGSYLDGSIVVGTTFSGTYTFESTTPIDPQSGDYAFPPSPEVVMTLDMGDYNLVEPLSSIRVTDGATDWYEVYSSRFMLAGLSAIMTLEFIDYGGSLLTNNALPLSPPDIGLADARWFMLDLGMKDVYVQGDVLSITPEPQTAGLLLLGGLLAAHIGKKKH